MKSLLSPIAVVGFAGVAQASLWVDFNSNQAAGQQGPSNNAGYQPYTRTHESDADLGPSGNRTEVYSTTFAITGPASVSLTPDWTNTTSLAVRQSIGRTDGFNNNWNDTDVDLVADWLGIDTRGGNNGNWDGTNGTPTYLTLTLSGLAAADYTWTSFHQDTENVHGDFAVWLDTGGGFVQLADGVMTDSTSGGSPDSMNLVTDFAGMEANGSIYRTSFTANGTDDVTIRFAPYANTAVHRQLFGVNGFQLEQVPEPSTGLLGLFGSLMLLRRRR